MAVWWQGADKQKNVSGISRPSGGGGGSSSGGGGPHRRDTGGPPGRGSTAPSRAAIESAQRANRAAKERQQEREKEQQQQQQQQQQENLLQKAQNVVMRKGEHVSDPTSTTKKSWEAAGKVPTGQHKLRSQYDRLAAKYGPGWEKTSQAQDLANYLSGVSVERGGGLGAQDPTYGGLTSWDQLDPDSEAYRQQLLAGITAPGAKGPASQYANTGIAALKNMNFDLARGNLTPDQYFNFRQQLMAADPSIGNVEYKKTFPFASGDLISGVGSLMPGIGTIGRIAKSALGKAQDVGQGIAQSIPSGLLSLFNKARDVVTPAGGQGGGGGGQQLAYQQELPVSGPIRQEETTLPYQGVIGGMPGISQPGYGGSIGREYQVRTADWIDKDEDKIDDRDQAGPGQPHWRGYEQNFAGATPGLPQAPLAPSALTPGSALAMSPITHQLQFQQPNVNWQQWNQNLRRFS